MADSTKYIPINGRTLFPDLKLKNIFSFRTKTTRAFVYVFVAIFVAVTFFLAFNPSSDPSSPWFNNIFADTSINLKPNATTTSPDTRSQFSSIYSYIFRNSSQSNPNSTVSRSHNFNLDSPADKKQSNGSNQTAIESPKSQIGSNQTTIESQQHEKGLNQTAIESPTYQLAKNQTIKKVPNLGTESGESVPSNFTENKVKPIEKPQESVPTSLVNSTGSGSKGNNNNNNNVTDLGKKQGNDEKKQGIEYLVKNLVSCDLFDGEWVKDESYPLYKPGSCSLIDEQFNCFNNGRPDLGFQNYKWKPKGCTIPRYAYFHLQIFNFYKF